MTGRDTEAENETERKRERKREKERERKRKRDKEREKERKKRERERGFTEYRHVGRLVVVVRGASPKRERLCVCVFGWDG